MAASRVDRCADEKFHPFRTDRKEDDTTHGRTLGDFSDPPDRNRTGAERAVPSSEENRTPRGLAAVLLQGRTRSELPFPTNRRYRGVPGRSTSSGGGPSSSGADVHLDHALPPGSGSAAFQRSASGSPMDALRLARRPNGEAAYRLRSHGRPLTKLLYVRDLRPLPPAEPAAE